MFNLWGDPPWVRVQGSLNFRHPSFTPPIDVSANLHGVQALLDSLATPHEEEVGDPLKWWDSQQEQYGDELVNMAMDYLSIPGKQIALCCKSKTYHLAISVGVKGVFSMPTS